MIELLKGLLSVAYALLVLAIIALLFVKSKASFVADIFAIIIVVALIIIIALAMRRVIKSSSENI